MKQPLPEAFNKLARMIASYPDVVSWIDEVCEDEKRRLAYRADDFKVAQGRFQIMLELSDLIHSVERNLYNK